MEIPALRTPERDSTQGEHSIDALTVAPDLQQPLGEANDRVDASVSVGKDYATVTDGKFRHPRDGQLDVTPLATDELEHFK